MGTDRAVYGFLLSRGVPVPLARRTLPNRENALRGIASGLHPTRTEDAAHMSDSTGRRIMVTGGLGFVGSFISEAFAQRGDQVTVVDSCVSSVVEAEELQAPSGSVEFVGESVEDYLVKLGSLDGFDMVVHCAS